MGAVGRRWVDAGWSDMFPMGCHVVVAGEVGRIGAEWSATCVGLIGAGRGDALEGLRLGAVGRRWVDAGWSGVFRMGLACGSHG